MKPEDFHFDLPDDLIAQYPAKERTASRLMQVSSDGLSHHSFKEVINFIEPGDLLVFNDTKVIPARLFGQKATGGKIEVLMERMLDDKRMLAQVRASKTPKAGEQLYFGNDIILEVVGRGEKFYEVRYNGDDHTLLEIIETIGQIPLPPYMNREPDQSDKERYQTVYAKHKGSVAAPTAGFHFDEALLQQLRDKGVEFGYLTLHIGAGTFAPIRVDNIKDHTMHSEYIEVKPELCEQIKAAKARGNRVISVGTTSLRALESASQSGEIQPFYGDTQIFIYPGYEFHAVDALITNMHLPSSTLLMLTCAFGGYNTVMHAYREAVKNNYHFYSYGDAMLISRA
jgi:S-adenosylmethionine:tRNA ribosyltransferase-isomerase